MTWIAPSEKGTETAALEKHTRDAADVRANAAYKFWNITSPVPCLIFLLPTLITANAKPVPLGPGNHTRTLTIGAQQRSYLIHIPKGHDLKQPSPVVLALHGAAMNGALMAAFCGLNETSDKDGFIVVYPNGTGSGQFLVWNVGGLQGLLAENSADDVAFIRKLLDELGPVVKVDS